MEAKKCDRKSCGKFFESSRKNVNNKILIFKDYWAIDNGEKYDLCPDCMSKLKDFLESKK